LKTLLTSGKEKQSREKVGIDTAAATVKKSGRRLSGGLFVETYVGIPGRESRRVTQENVTRMNGHISCGN